jgi:glycosyltransferase involved in cell wall biosynthesis
MAKFGLDTLFENPFRASGATGYMRLLVSTLAELDRQNEYVLFVSRENRHLYAELVPDTWRLVELPHSAEHPARRVATQQFAIPRVSKELGLSTVFFPGNTVALGLSCPSVLAIKTLHHLNRSRGLDIRRMLFRRMMVGQSARRAKLIIANSVYTRTRIEQELGIPRSKIRIVYEAVSGSFQPPVDKEAARLLARQRFGLGRDWVLFVSSLWRYKNADRLIQAFATVVREGQPLDLVLAGRDEGDNAAGLKQLAADLGIADRVRFLGYVPNEDLTDLYAGARVFVYPSLEETFGLTLVEAMRSGVPVVASNVSSIPEILGNAGLLVTPTDHVDIARGLLAVLHDSELQRTLVDRGFNRARDFTPSAMAKGTLETLLEASELN